MSNYLILTLTLIAGILLGAIFFGGLWWTVRKGISSHAAFWFLGSLIFRMSIVLMGFYFVGHGDWRRLVSCLIGFIVARFIVMRLTQTPIEKENSKTKEVGHAP